MTSLLFMLWLVPAPAWKRATTRWSLYAPASLIRTWASTKSLSGRRPEMGKLATARAVCAPYHASLGTLTSPSESFSMRNSFMVGINADITKKAILSDVAGRTAVDAGSSRCAGGFQTDRHRRQVAFAVWLQGQVGAGELLGNLVPALPGGNSRPDRVARQQEEQSGRHRRGHGLPQPQACDRFCRRPAGRLPHCAGHRPGGPPDRAGRGIADHVFVQPGRENGREAGGGDYP